MSNTASPAQVIVITGASDGIGGEMARQLARQHGKSLGLVLAARTAATLQTVAAQCEALGAQCLVVPTDVSVQAQCQALIASATERFGRIDGLINNAGISAQALFAQVRADDLGWYEQLMRINLWGSVWCTHAALPHLQKSRGRIVAVSSLAGLIGVPGRTAYSASKFAMTGFFEALRAEMVGAGVSVTWTGPDGYVAKATYARRMGSNPNAAVNGQDQDGSLRKDRVWLTVNRSF